MEAVAGHLTGEGRDDREGRDGEGEEVEHRGVDDEEQEAAPERRVRVPRPPVLRLPLEEQQPARRRERREHHRRDADQPERPLLDEQPHEVRRQVVGGRRPRQQLHLGDLRSSARRRVRVPWHLGDLRSSARRRVRVPWLEGRIRVKRLEDPQ